MKKSTKENIFWVTLMILVTGLFFFFPFQPPVRKNYDEPIHDQRLLYQGVDTRGVIYRYNKTSARSATNNVFYYFRTEDFLFYGSVFGSFPNCENDSSCIGKTYRVRYLPSDPNVHQIFFFDKRNGINWTDTMPEKR
ncbi:MAG: hypothetical protein RL757_2742 [Bacteroidota bacterium]|jgi:hypothetical protein